jgi:hypothetical protein
MDWHREINPAPCWVVSVLPLDTGRPWSMANRAAAKRGAGEADPRIDFGAACGAIGGKVRRSTFVPVTDHGILRHRKMERSSSNCSRFGRSSRALHAGCHPVIPTPLVQLGHHHWMPGQVLDSAWQVADTSRSVRQGTTGPRQGNSPTCFDPDSVLGTFFQPVSAGHRRLMKGGRP